MATITAGVTLVLPYMVMMLLVLSAFVDISSICTNNARATVRKSEIDLTHDGSCISVAVWPDPDPGLGSPPTFCHGLSYLPESNQ